MYVEDLKPGDKLKDFRGDEHTFKQILSLATPGRSGKIQTNKGVYYVTIFNLTWKPQ